jgi:hypothetical protein
MLVTTLTQLGLEYPLLKKSIVPGSRMLGTSLVIELVISLASIPFVFIVINTIYDESIKQFTWVSVALLVVLSIEFVARFGLLGISNARTVLIIDRSYRFGNKISNWILFCIYVSWSIGYLTCILA